MSVDSLPHQIPRHRLRGIPRLHRRLPQCPQRHRIRPPERGDVIRQPVLLTELLHHRRYAPELAPGEAGEQMVLDLKLQSAVEPVHPRRAADVEGPTGLLLEPIVGPRHPDIGGGGEVVERELHVLDAGDDEAAGDEEDSFPPIREVGDEEWVPNPENQ